MFNENLQATLQHAVYGGILNVEGVLLSYPEFATLIPVPGCKWRGLRIRHSILVFTVE